MKRRLVAVGWFGVTALLVAGCHLDGSRDESATATRTTAPEPTIDAAAPSGKSAPETSATPASPPPPVLVSQAQLGAVIVTPEMVSELLGAKLGFVKERLEPASPYTIAGEQSRCAPLTALASSQTLGSDYTAYRGVSERDKEDAAASDHTVRQDAAAYADVKSARAAFGTAFDPALRDCNGALVHVDGEDAQNGWRLEVKELTAERVQVNKIQLKDGKPMNWSCGNTARTKNNVIYSALVCQWGDDAPAGAVAITDRMQSFIPD